MQSGSVHILVAARGHDMTAVIAPARALTCASTPRLPVTLSCATVALTVQLGKLMSKLSLDSPHLNQLMTAQQPVCLLTCPPPPWLLPLLAIPLQGHAPNQW